METYVITWGTKSYEVEAETRSKAINRAAHMYRDETRVPYSTPVLVSAARTGKVGTRRYEKPEIKLV
jgi:hypothetical protein